MEKIKNVFKRIGVLVGMLFIALLEVRPFIVLLVYSLFSYVTNSVETALFFLVVACGLYIKDRFDYLDDKLKNE